MKETNEITNLQARFFYNTLLYCLTELPIAIVHLYWQVFFFLEYFPQTDVFAWICAVYGSLIIGCMVRYPIIDVLRYMVEHGCIVMQETRAVQFNRLCN